MSLFTPSDRRFWMCLSPIDPHPTIKIPFRDNLDHPDKIFHVMGVPLVIGSPALSPIISSNVLVLNHIPAVLILHLTL